MKASDGSVAKSWIYSGTDTFIGIKAADGTVYNVGSSFTVSGLLRADKTSSFSVLTESDPDPDPDASYTHTVVIGSDSFVFTGTTGAPHITFEINDSYFTMSTSADVKIWQYRGSGTF